MAVLSVINAHVLQTATGCAVEPWLCLSLELQYDTFKYAAGSIQLVRLISYHFAVGRDKPC